jgi:hypothetical protein
MPTMAEEVAAGPLKIIYLGNSKSGKTGSLASLALAGYKLHILDYDNGASIIRNILRAKNPKALANVEYETLTDTYKSFGANVKPHVVKAWAEGNNLLTKWTNTYRSLDDIIIIDSLNFATKAAFNWILQTVNRLDLGKKEIQDWGAAQDLVSQWLGMLYAKEVSCHIIVTSHILWYGGDEETGGIVMGLPKTAVGKSFSPDIPRYFNTAIMARVAGTGVGVQREIYTRPMDNVALGSEAPGLVQPSYPLDTGMAQLFKDIRGTEPGLK